MKYKKNIIVLLIFVLMITSSCSSIRMDGIYYSHNSKPISLNNGKFINYENIKSGMYYINRKHMSFEYNPGNDENAFFESYIIVNKNTFFSVHYKMEIENNGNSQRCIRKEAIGNDNSFILINLDLFTDGTYRETTEEGDILESGEYYIESNRIYFCINGNKASKYFYCIYNNEIYFKVYEKLT